MLYILSWAFCLALLLAVYKVFLCGTTFHRFNRFLLLGFLALSAVLPLCHIETEHTDIAIANTEFVRTLETLQENHATAVVTDVDVVQYPEQTVSEEENSPVWPYLLVGIYLMYVLIILSGWVRSTVKMKRFLRSCRRYRLGRWVRLAVHKNLFGPFNWMNYIVVPDEERKLHTDVAVCHEMAHVRCLHCIDLVVVGVCALVNPVAWLLLRELKALHEYEADDHVLRSGRLEAKTYQTLLIKKTVGAEAYALASCLNFNLKNRIIMMKKEQTNRWRKAWLLAAIPVAGVALAVFAVPASEAKAENGASFDVSTAKVAKADIPLQPDASRAVNLYVEKDGDVYCSVNGHQFFKHEKQQIDIELGDIVSQGVMSAYESNKPTNVHITCEKGTDAEIYKSVQGQVRTALAKTKSKVDNPEKINERIAVHNNEYRALLGKPTVADNDSIYKVVEHLPEYPGGMAELFNFLKNNLVYPQECNAVPGFGMRVIVQVVVEKDGSLSGITVLNDKDNNKETAENKMARDAARKEAVRVVQSMPKWTPAKHKGKTVRCYFIVPIVFRAK